jgi:hypothetical protein
VATQYAKQVAGTPYTKEMYATEMYPREMYPQEMVRNEMVHDQAHDTRPARQGHGPTKRELYELAKARGVQGRSKMSKTELERALYQA